MILISTVKELLKQDIDTDSILKLCDTIYEKIDFVSADYPKHKSWFYQKHLPETLQKESGRDIIFAYTEDNAIVGTAFIKKDEKEKKICTLFVDENYRNLGVGTKLVERSMKLLGTTKPLITITDYKLPMFKAMIKKYNWKQTQAVKGLYNDAHTELVYNNNQKSVTK